MPGLGLVTILATTGLSLAGCQRVGVPPPVAPVSAAACATPTLDPASWAQRTDSAGVSYRVPDGFTERPPGDSPYREFRYDGEISGRIVVGFSPGSEHYTTLRRVPSPGMREMSECVDDVGGRRVLFQAWRMEDGSFRDGRRYDLFEVLALVPVEPTLTFFVTGGGSSPRFQELLLGVARTVEVESP